jgi:hypothetical protein
MNGELHPAKGSRMSGYGHSNRELPLGGRAFAAFGPGQVQRLLTPFFRRPLRSLVPRGTCIVIEYSITMWQPNFLREKLDQKLACINDGLGGSLALVPPCPLSGRPLDPLRAIDER